MQVREGCRMTQSHPGLTAPSHTGSPTLSDLRPVADLGTGSRERSCSRSQRRIPPSGAAPGAGPALPPRWALGLEVRVFPFTISHRNREGTLEQAASWS